MVEYRNADSLGLIDNGLFNAFICHRFRLKADLKVMKVEKGTVEDSQGADSNIAAKPKSTHGRKKAIEDEASNTSMLKDDDDDDDEEDDEEEEKESDEDEADDDDAANDDNEDDESEDTDVRIIKFVRFHSAFVSWCQQKNRCI